ncbi:MAG: hypothetical protein EOP04_22925, partial [Proteobacteria bacterium]
MKKINAAPLPSQIYRCFRTGADAAKTLRQILQNLIENHIPGIEKKFTKEKNLSQQEVDKLRDKLSKESSSHGSRWIERILGTAATLGVYALIEGASEAGKYINDPDAYQTPGQRMVSEISYLQDRFSSASADLSRLNALKGDFKTVGAYNFSQLYFPAIFSLIASHGIIIYEELLHCAQHHSTSPDEIVSYLNNSDPRCANACMSLLRASYSTADLEFLRQYADSSIISASPEQRALLQFINQSVLVRIDFFDVWASKIFDLENKQHEITRVLASNSTKGLPTLEILGQQAITLSGKLPEAVLPVADTPATIDALTFALATDSDARKNVIRLIRELKDPANGNLKERH